MKRVIGFAAGVMAAVSVAAAGKGDADALAKFDRTGEMTSCVNMRSTTVTAIDEDTLLFRVGSGNYYVNETGSRCNDADSGFTRIELTLYGSQLCRGEIVSVINNSNGIHQGSCILGEFEKLVKKPPAEAAAQQ